MVTAPRHLPRRACLRFWRRGPGALAARSRQSHFRIPGYLGLDRHAVGCLDGSADVHRARRIHSGLSDEMIRMAVEQFLPSAAAGLLITIVLLRYAPFATWMLPGVWQVIFSLGVFSSCRFLPRPMIAAGAWYLLTGLSCIAMGGDRALSPWTMGIPYGAGQLLVAAILLFRPRRRMAMKSKPPAQRRPFRI